MAQTEEQRSQGIEDDLENVIVLGEEEEDEDGRGKKRERERENEGRRKKQKQEKSEEEKEYVVLKDPLEVRGRDIMLRILRNLDARSMALTLLVSRAWHGVASSDSLWTSKGLLKLAAYSLSVWDGKRVNNKQFTRIMREDLCDHVWEFHFTEMAPEYWRNLDPYWMGTGLPMRRYFHPDGSTTADPGDKVWGGHECCYYIVTSYVGEGRIREHYVRINRWPRLFVAKKEDWSWEMSNNLFCYSSIPDAYKEGGTGPLFAVL